jgi:hypothetical protein
MNDHIPYSDAYRIGKKQEEIMTQVMSLPDISTQWQTLNFEEIVARLR